VEDRILKKQLFCIAKGDFLQMLTAGFISVQTVSRSGDSRMQKVGGAA